MSTCESKVTTPFIYYYTSFEAMKTILNVKISKKYLDDTRYYNANIEV